MPWPSVEKPGVCPKVAGKTIFLERFCTDSYTGTGYSLCSFVLHCFYGQRELVGSPRLLMEEAGLNSRL
ncbi:hypothetical protein [Pseudomonas kairouanensis]|uniref:hypothetical protein n=1 Tax=Pseudomonas kairouanensis TaxID=2293832 RepID=UPI00107683FF|nr:hypothetical protein [Pseudomonas kairouanensis]